MTTPCACRGLAPTARSGIEAPKTLTRGHAPRTERGEWPLERCVAFSRNRSTNRSLVCSGDAVLQAGSSGFLSELDFLQHRRAVAVHVFSCTAVTHRSHRSAGAFSHFRTLWPVRGDDDGAVRDRIPRLARRRKLDGLPIPLQTSGPSPSAQAVCPVPAALRLESLVRFPGTVGATTRLW